jgi:hypothetical protein
MEDKRRQLQHSAQVALIPVMRSMVDFNHQALTQLNRHRGSDNEEKAIAILKKAIASFRLAAAESEASLDDLNDFVWAPQSLSSIPSTAFRKQSSSDGYSELRSCSELEVAGDLQPSPNDLANTAGTPHSTILNCPVYTFKVLVATILYHSGVSFHQKAISLSKVQNYSCCLRHSSNALNFYQMSESLLQSRGPNHCSSEPTHSPLVWEALNESVQQILIRIRRNEMLLRSMFHTAEAA